MAFPLGKFGSWPEKLARPRIFRSRCFIAGMLVLTTSDLIPIEDVQAGQPVLSYNRAAQVWEIYQVKTRHEREVDTKLVHLTVEYNDGSTELTEATGNHPL